MYFVDVAAFFFVCFTHSFKLIFYTPLPFFFSGDYHLYETDKEIGKMNKETKLLILETHEVTPRHRHFSRK